MPQSFIGKVDIKDEVLKTTIRLDGDSGEIIAGGGDSGKNGKLILRNNSGDDTIWLQGVGGDVILDGSL